jgi:hypothetical protein
MTHCSDDDLILAYYGESAPPEDHLAHCADCAARYRELRSTLELLRTIDVPQRGERYGLEVWQRIRHRLPDGESRWYAAWAPWQWTAAAATAALVLIAAGFVTGRVWSPEQPAAIATAPAADLDDAARKRVLMLTVADHLERSERVLTDIVNAPAGTDLSTEQRWADDLLAASRLYRQDALDSRELTMAAVLDDLERTLLEIVHRPSLATNEDLDAIRRRVDSVALLFKVRVLGSELREMSQPPVAAVKERRPGVPAGSSTLTSTIG